MKSRPKSQKNTSVTVATWTYILDQKVRLISLLDQTFIAAALQVQGHCTDTFSSNINAIRMNMDMFSQDVCLLHSLFDVSFSSTSAERALYAVVSHKFTQEQVPLVPLHSATSFLDFIFLPAYQRGVDLSIGSWIVAMLYGNLWDNLSGVFALHQPAKGIRMLD